MVQPKGLRHLSVECRVEIGSAQSDHGAMPSHLSSPWNSAVAFLKMSFADTVLASGSGFFWRADGRTHLVTNWHNLAGRNPLTQAPMSNTGGLPDSVVFHAFRQVTQPDERGLYAVDTVPVGVPLYDEAGARWREHPHFGRHVDVASIDVTDYIRGLQVEHANDVESFASLDSRVSQEAFIIGFPFGLIVNAPVPIWKRGTIALDPTFDPDGLPKMFIDTATREGMSGAVVVARHITVGRSYRRKDGSESEPVIYAKHDLVVGIYSGRHYPDLDRAQLGIVWKRSAVETTVSHGVRYVGDKPA